MPLILTSQSAWVLLLFAGLLEIVWTISMKASHGFTKHHYTAITLVAATLSFWLLGLAMVVRPSPTWVTWSGAAPTPGRHCLCSLDRDRHCRSGNSRYRDFR